MISGVLFFADKGSKRRAEKVAYDTIEEARLSLHCHLGEVVSWREHLFNVPGFYAFNSTTGRSARIVGAPVTEFFTPERPSE